MSFNLTCQFTSTIQLLSNLFMSKFDKCKFCHKYKNNVATLLNTSLTHSACNLCTNWTHFYKEIIPKWPGYGL